MSFTSRWSPTVARCSRARTASGLCKAHDFVELHLAAPELLPAPLLHQRRAVPRVDCPDHGVKRVTVPWARAAAGSRCCSSKRH